MDLAADATGVQRRFLPRYTVSTLSSKDGLHQPTLKHTLSAKAVIVYYDEQSISLETLIEIHLLTHNATSNHTFRKKYRSAVYTFDPVQQYEAGEILQQKQKLFTKPLITRIYPFERFKKNEERYLNYYHKNPHLPFCQTRIAPKLKLLFDKYAEYAIVPTKKE